MPPKLGKSSFLLENLLNLQFYRDLTWKTDLFKNWFWFKLTNLWLVLGTVP